MARSSTSGWSLDGNIAFRDVITQQRKQLPSRLTLDDRRLTEYRGVFEAVKETIREQAARKEGPSRVGSLRDACLAVLAEELLFGHLKAEKKEHAPAATARSDSSMAGAEAERSTSMEDNALSVLWDPESGRPRLPDPLCAGLLERILAFLPFDDATLPFGLFLAFTRVYMRSDVVFRRLAGARRRDLVVYPGLVLSDSLELAQLASVGVPRPDRAWGSFPQFSCLTILDLSFFATWKDEDMHSLKHSVGTTLAWLALEGTQVTDTGVGHLCRACHYEDAEGTEEEEGGPSGESAAERTRRLGPRERFCRLQAITLKGLKGITDKGIAKVAALPSIRLLDVRGTACTSAAKWILTSNLDKAPGVATVRPTPAQPFLSASAEMDRRLFSSTYTLSHRLTLLQRRVGLEGVEEPERDPRAKVLKVLIDLTERTDRSEAKPNHRPPILGLDWLEARHKARSTTYGTIYTTAPVAADAVAEDASKENARGAAFRMQSHGQAKADVGWTAEGLNLWRIGNKRERRRKAGEEAASEDEAEPQVEVEVPPAMSGMILRLKPLSLDPAVPPASSSASRPYPSGKDLLNPIKARKLANAPRDAEQLKIKAPTKRPLEDLLGLGSSTNRRRVDGREGTPSSASTNTNSPASSQSSFKTKPGSVAGSSASVLGSRASTPSDLGPRPAASASVAPKGRLGMATSKASGWGSSIESRAKSSFFRR